MGDVRKDPPSAVYFCLWKLETQFPWIRVKVKLFFIFCEVNTSSTQIRLLWKSVSNSCVSKKYYEEAEERTRSKVDAWNWPLEHPCDLFLKSSSTYTPGLETDFRRQQTFYRRACFWYPLRERVNVELGSISLMLRSWRCALPLSLG